MKLSKKELGKDIPAGIRLSESFGWQEGGVLRVWGEGDIVRNPSDIEALKAHNAPHEELQ